MAGPNILEPIRLAMDEEMGRDERVMVLGEDVGKKGGVFGATEGLWAKFGDKRVLDTPLTEGMIAGAAMGAAASRSSPPDARSTRTRNSFASEASLLPRGFGLFWRSSNPSVYSSESKPFTAGSISCEHHQVTPHAFPVLTTLLTVWPMNSGR